MFLRKLIFITFSILLVSSAAWGQVPPHIWSHRFGDSEIQNAQSVAVDNSNNVVITGYFAGSVDFGGGPLICAGNYDIYIAKFDSAGNHLWSKHFGDSDDQRSYSVIADVSGNIVITGHLAGAVYFGGDTLTSEGSVSGFVAKFDSNGNHLWSQCFNDTGSSSARGVAVDGSSNVIVTGTFSGSVDFGGDILTSVADVDIFVAKLDPDGNHLWSQRFCETGRQYVHGIATDVLGNVVVAGYFTGSVYFGGDTLLCAGNYDIYLAKFDPNGNHLWSQRFGDWYLHYAFDATTDGSANVIITGEFCCDVYFGGDTLTAVSGLDIYVAKFDPYGNHLWSQSFEGSNLQQGRAIAVDSSDNIIISASFYGTVDFGGGTLTSAGASDIYVAKFDANGEHVWSVRYGDPGTQQGMGVAVDGSDNVIVTGYFDSNVFFGGDALTSEGLYDIFLVKLGPIGVTAIGEQPIEYQLEIQAYPNPFNATTMIRFDLPRKVQVKLSVYNVKGELVSTIIDRQMTAGRKEVIWSAKDNRGRSLSSGIYFCRLVAGDFVQARKIVLMR